MIDISEGRFADILEDEIIEGCEEHGLTVAASFLRRNRGRIVIPDGSDFGSRYNDWLSLLEENGELMYECRECGDEAPGKLQRIPDDWHFENYEPPHWEYPGEDGMCLCNDCFDSLVEDIVEHAKDAGVKSEDDFDDFCVEEYDGIGENVYFAAIDEFLNARSRE